MVASATRLPYDCNSVDEIVGYHFIEHLTLYDAVLSFLEFYRVLKARGTLAMELPNMNRCIAMIQSNNKEEYRLGMGGLYGYLPEFHYTGDNMLHRWGWTPFKIVEALANIGYKDIEIKDSTQLWRKAYKYKRDMRVECHT